MGFNEDIYAEMGDILDGDFSQSVTIEVGAASADLFCIFSKTYADVNPANGVPIQSNSPVLGIDKTAADAALGVALSEGPTSFATIDGIKYRIKRVEPDGTGFAQVFLAKYLH